ncbi:MAG: hypothetical protein ACRBB3_01580 [Alphaproteobacteria bacterium]
MRHEQGNTWFLIPFEYLKGQEFFNKLVVSLSILALSGCVTTDKSEPLAPSPPKVLSNSLSDHSSHVSYQPHYFSAPMQTDLLSVDVSPIVDEISQEKGIYLPSNESEDAILLSSKCSLNDRFDRKAVVAYEWGRSRLSLDVDGVGLGGGDDRGVRVQYKIRLQPEKTKKQRCRYSSSWQGLVGSGYNEFFIRKENTVWSEISDVKNSARQYIDKFF